MPFFEYEAVVAKCRCLYGKLLTPNDYENLLKCQDVSDIAFYLHGSTAYGEFIDSHDLRKIKRNKLEYYIKKSMLADYLKMYKFTSGNQRHFISLLMAKYEFEYILRVWRDYVLKDAGENESIDGGDYVFNERFLEIQAIYRNNPRIDIEALKNIANAGQFINAIRNSEYFYVFEKHINKDISKNYTEIETAVYDEYYKILYDGAEFFDKDIKEKIQDGISSRTDLINLCRISRLKFNFRAGPEEIRAMLVPVRNRLKPDDITALINCDIMENFLEYCEFNLYYGKKQSFYDYDSVTAYTDAFLYKYYKSKINIPSSGFEVVVRYFHLKEYEIINLFYLTEGIRYKMPQDYIRKNIYGLDNISERG